MGIRQTKPSSTSCCRRKNKKREYSANPDEPPNELSRRHSTRSSKIKDAAKDNVPTETVQGTLSVHVVIAPSSADVPITRETVSGSATRPGNVASDSELQPKSKLIRNKTETASELEVLLTSLESTGPSSKSSLGGSGTTLKTGHSQNSPRRISRKKKQGQTRLKHRGESNSSYSNYM